MLVIGLAGQAGSGKNEVASYLAAKYGFVQFAFSDSIYHEVQQAYGFVAPAILRDRATKDSPHTAMRLAWCTDPDFKVVARRAIARDYPDTFGVLDDYELSPRWVLQVWGCEYRRAQDPNYWVKKAAEFVTQMHYLPPYPELRPQLFVECGTRFENERDWIKHNYMAGDTSGGNLDHAGQIWHIHRDATDQMTDPHASARPLPILPGEREIWNNSTIEHLHLAVDMLLSTRNQFIRCEPQYEGPWCCEKAAPLGVPVCPDCAEASTAYQAAMGPGPAEEVLPGGQYYKVQSDGHKMLCNADGTRSIFDDVDE